MGVCLFLILDGKLPTILLEQPKPKKECHSRIDNQGKILLLLGITPLLTHTKT